MAKMLIPPPVKKSTQVFYFFTIQVIYGLWIKEPGSGAEYLLVKMEENGFIFFLLNNTS